MEMLLDWRSVGSLIATVMVFRTAMRNLVPPEAEQWLRRILARVAAAFRAPTATIFIDEADGAAITSVSNDLYDAAHLYLGAHCLAAAPAVRLYKPREASRAVASLPDDHTTHDTWKGVTVKWTSTVRPADSGCNVYGGGRGPSVGGDQRSLELQFLRQYRDFVHDSYIPHVIDEATRLRVTSRERRLYTNGDEYSRLWTSHAFSHPSTFDTLAFDPALREELRGDLLRFASRREYYARVGRAWKRGYLLHGPPGTGKTSLVAAIANLLLFDVYDLELTTVATNSHLRRLLVSTTPKSVVVIEDIDCSLDLADRRRKNDQDNNNNNSAQMATVGRESLSLSGVLNFVDGLWSSCVGERLVIFTTNHPERLDPALLRPGRMDRKIELGYCSPAALRVLAKNYLGVGADDDTVNGLMAQAEGLLAAGVRITPADIGEVFMGCDGAGASAALRKLVRELSRRKSALTADDGASCRHAESEIDLNCVRGLEKDPPLSREPENHLQGAVYAADREVLSVDIQEPERASHPGQWLGKTSTAVDLIRGMCISAGYASPGSPPSFTPPTSKKTIMLSPASPLDTGCWSPAPTDKPLKKLNHAMPCLEALTGDVTTV